MIRFVASIIACLIVLPATAHPPESWHAQKAVLAQWAEAFSISDEALVAQLDGGNPLSQAFIEDATQVITRYADYTAHEAGVTASPVVIMVDNGTFRMIVDVHLTEASGDWKISSVTPSRSAMPEALVHLDLPEHTRLHNVQFELLDASSKEPVHARVRIVDENGDYWPPDGHQKNIRTGWREDVGGDVRIDNKTWAYVSPSFNARLPKGNYAIEVAKGVEYFPTAKFFSVGAKQRKPHAIEVNRWSNLNTQGWYAGDTHTHFMPDQTALLELRAEDLSVIYVLATKWEELVTDTLRFTGKPSAYSSNTELVVVNEETRHGWLGHTILHGIKELVYPLSWGGPSEGVVGGFDYPAMAHQADKAHEVGGLVTWAHFPSPGGELALDIALGKIDTVDLFTWGNAFTPVPQFDGSMSPSALDSWYMFLNTGSRLPATAGTDKMLNVQVSGSVRTWAHVGDTFSYKGWLDALKKGKTFVSTGPAISLKVNGAPIGSDLKLAAGEKMLVEAKLSAPYDLYPIEKLEVVVGGKIVASVANEEQASSLHIRTELTVDESTWIAARANGSHLLPLQSWPMLGTAGIPPMAHTSPIYLTVNNQPVWSNEAAAELKKQVQRAVDWASNTANYMDESQRAEIVALYKSALEVYEQR